MANNVLIGTSQTWTTASNWSTGSAPVSGDIPFLTNNTTIINAGLNNASVVLTTLNLVQDFTGRVGVNGSSNQYLQIASTTVYLGIAPTGGAVANGSSLFNLDVGTSSSTINVLTSSNAGSGTGQAPIKLLGTALTINLTGGIISVAALPTENATINTMNVVPSGQGIAPQAWVGPGCNMKTLVLTGGYVTSQSQSLTVNAQIAGSNTRLVYQGSGGFNALTIDAGGSVAYNGSGSVNSLTVTGAIDLSGGGGPVTFGNTTFYAGASFYDPLGRAIFTNQPTIVNTTRAAIGINLGLGRYV